jgi:hypothetical protein
MVRAYNAKLDQLNRVRELICPTVTPRNELLKVWTAKASHKRRLKTAQNRLKKCRKAKRQAYKRFKEHSETARKRSDPVTWALMPVDNVDIRSWLHRRLVAIVDDGGLLEADLRTAFNAVGDSDQYYESVKARLKILPQKENSDLDPSLIDRWATSNMAEKQKLITDLNLSAYQISTLRESARLLRVEKRRSKLSL